MNAGHGAQPPQGAQPQSSSGQPALVLGDPAHSGGLKLDEHCGPFQPIWFCDSMISWLLCVPVAFLGVVQVFPARDLFCHPSAHRCPAGMGVVPPAGLRPIARQGRASHLITKGALSGLCTSYLFQTLSGPLQPLLGIASLQSDKGCASQRGCWHTDEQQRLQAQALGWRSGTELCR